MLKVLVTGGTSGLGLAMASALAAAGARVALTGRSAAHAAEVAAELPGAAGIELDVREESSVARAVGQAWTRLGGIDMLVNNAGIGMRTVNPRFMTHPQGFWEVAAAGGQHPRGDLARHQEVAGQVGLDHRPEAVGGHASSTSR